MLHTFTQLSDSAWTGDSMEILSLLKVQLVDCFSILAQMRADAECCKI